MTSAKKRRSILVNPKWDREFWVFSDASDVGIGAVLAQKPYLETNKFRCITDHKALTSIRKIPFTGKENSVSDWLSRHPSMVEKFHESVEIESLFSEISVENAKCRF